MRVLLTGIACLFIMITFGQKNVVLIVADDLGARDLSVNGNDFIETPALEVFNEGWVEYAYASAPICSPTRASIITGLAPARVGITEHFRGTPPVPNSQRLIPPSNVPQVDKSLPTIASVLRDAGYQTAIVGKWHLGGGQQGPRNYGYEYSFASGSPGLPNSFFYPFFNGNTFPELTSVSQSGDYLTDIIGDEAARYIADTDTSFFLHVNFYSPHVPIQARPDLLAKYEAKRANNPGELLPDPHYAAMVESIDINFNKIITALKDKGIEDETLIIFTSDHGGLHVKEVPGFDQHTPPTDNGSLRAGKGYLYEGGIRVPFLSNIIRDEGQYITSSDYFNTIMGYVGLPERTQDGIDMINASGTDRQLYWHFPHYSPQRGRPMASIISGRYKLIWHYGRNYYELFDILNDPEESVNLAHKEELIIKLRDDLNEWLGEVGAKLPQPNPNYDPEGKVVKESFDYAIGQFAGNEGEGWYSQWDRLDSTLVVTIADENLKLVEGRYLKIRNEGSTPASIARELDTPFGIDSRRDLEYWMTYIVADLDEKLSLSFINEFEENFASIEINSNSLTITSNNQSNTQQLGQSSNEIVVKLKAVSRATDTIFVWVNPDKTQLPSSSDALTLPVDFKGKYVDRITYALGAGGAVALDEIAMGASYANISPLYTPSFSDIYEPFEYDESETLEGLGGNGSGFKNGWRNVGRLADNIAEVSPISLVVEGIDPVGNKAQFDYKTANTQIRFDREFSAPLFSQGEEYYLSFLVDGSLNGTRNNVFNLNLVNGSLNNKTGLVVAIGKLYGSEKLGVVLPQSNQQFATDISSEGLHWIVMKVVTSVNAVEDDIFMWVDPSPYQEPIEAQADLQFKTSDLNLGIDRIRLRAEGAGNGQVPLQVAFDEIRINRAWLGLVSTVKRIDAPQVKVFPNPVSTTLHLDGLTAFGDGTLSIHTIDGRVLLHQQLTGIDKLQVDLHSIQYSGYATLTLSSDTYSDSISIFINRD